VNPEEPGAFLRPDYFGELARLRRDAPVEEFAAGCYTVARYRDVRAISRDPETFCSSRGVLVNDPLRHGGTIEGSILHMDPPAHGPWRALVGRRFTPRAVALLEDRVRAVARRVLDAVPAGQPIDLVEAIAAPFPVLVIAELLGIATADETDFRRWSDATIESTDAAVVRVDDLLELHNFLVAHVRDRRASPRDDLVSVLVGSEVGGHALSTREAVTYVLALLVAGNETTRHLVSGSLLALAEHPDQRAALRAAPARLGAAVEECLRWITPIQAFGRTVVRDVTLGDTALAAGDWLVMLYASANRDEAVFGPTADRFDIGRHVTGPHVAFGFGEHLCLGAALARLEARVMLDEVLARFGDYSLTGDPEWVPSTLVRGLARLPGTLRAGS